MSKQQQKPKPGPIKYKLVTRNNVEDFTSEDWSRAQAEIGLTHTEHGRLTLDRETGCGTAIALYEFAMYVPENQTFYYSIDGRLYAGNAVLYAFDAMGETIDHDKPVVITFYRDAAHAEDEINAGNLVRPYFAVDSEVIWAWPAAPLHDMRVMQLMQQRDGIRFGDRVYEFIGNDDESSMELGSCCSCGKGAPEVSVRNIFMLGFRSPTPGTGWGCVSCNLPTDGAIAVVCDACKDACVEPKWMCTGYASTDGRTPMPDEKDRVPFEHNVEIHRAKGEDI